MELFRLLGTVAIENETANKAIDNTTSIAEAAQGKLSSVFSNIGSFAVNAGKVIASGLAVGATAMTGLTMKALNAAGDLEQNMGGSEAVFGEYASSMQEAANSAFSSMGLSATDFLSTANKMGALFQGSGFGIEESASISAQAMQRAADVASIMGIDVSTAMESVAGAAKGNFTMMDNLGVSMNATTIEAYALSKGIDKSYNSMTNYEKTSLAMEMFLEKTAYATGNYSKENETLAGSLTTAKSALTNFLSGAGDVDSLVGALVNAADVIIENLQTILPRLVTGIQELINQLLPYLPAMIEALLPGVISGAISLLTGLVVALPEVLQILIAALPSIFAQIGAAATAAFPTLLETFKGLFGQIFDYISLELLGTETDFDTAFAKIQEIFNTALGVLQEVWNSIGQPVFDIVRSAVESAQEIFAEKMPEIEEFVSTCFTDIQSFWNNNLKPCLDAISNFIKTVLAPAFDVVFNSYIKAYVDTTFNKIKSLWENTLKPVFTGITDFLTGVFTLNFDQALTGVLNIATGIFNGILTAIQTPMELAKNVVNNAIDFIKEKFNFTWELPKLKLPHFSVSGKFSLNPPSIPSFSVSWYKKAMDNAMLLDNPTIFGAAGGELLGAGEAGQEVVSGADTLMGMISNAVAEQNAGLVEVLVKILNAITSMDGNMEDSFKNALDGTPFKVNNREFGRLVKAVT